MSGKIQEIGIIILKQYKKSNLLIVGQGSIGKKYKKVSKHFFQPSKVQVFSKHLKKTRDKLDKINNSDKNFVILSNKVTERLKYFTKFFKKKTTFLFEKPFSHKTFSKTEERNFYELISKHDVKIKSGYCLRLNPAVIEAKKRIKNNLHNILTIKPEIKTRPLLLSKDNLTKRNSYCFSILFFLEDKCNTPCLINSRLNRKTCSWKKIFFSTNV